MMVCTVPLSNGVPLFSFSIKEAGAPLLRTGARADTDTGTDVWTQHTDANRSLILFLFNTEKKSHTTLVFNFALMAYFTSSPIPGIIPACSGAVVQ